MIALGSAVPVQAASATKPDKMVVCNSGKGLNLLASPSAKARVVTHLKDFHTVLGLGPASKSGEFLKVKDLQNGKVGWMLDESLCGGTGDKKALSAKAIAAGLASQKATTVSATSPTSVSMPSASETAEDSSPVSTASFLPSGGVNADPMIGSGVVNVCGLSQKVMKDAASVASTIGPYVFDGVHDCYGFDTQVWAKEGVQLPRGPFPDSRFAPIKDWTQLKAGDVVTTAQGWFAGGNWHGGLFAGMDGSTPLIFDDSPGNANGGALKHPLPWPGYFSYYYIPTHQKLVQGSQCGGTNSSSMASASGPFPGGAFGNCVVQRESSGNPNVMNSSGHYGLYQFSASTWALYGGNPADFGNASVSQQEQVFMNALNSPGGYNNWTPYDGCQP